MGGLLSACVVHGFSYENCTHDGRCTRTEVSVLNGIERLDPETGVMTNETVVDQLETSAAYRFPLAVDRAVLGQIPAPIALKYLQQAAAAATGPYRVCSYSATGIGIQGYDPLPYSKVHIATAHGPVRSQDTYVVFARYSPDLLHEDASCIAYRRISTGDAETGEIVNEMQRVTEALLSVGANLD